MSNTLTLWEDTDLIEQWKKSENKLISAPSDGINETKNVSVKNGCDVIGNKKKWIRNCPKCNRELSYSSKSHRNIADRLQTLCYRCAFTGRLRSEEYRDKIRQSLLGRKLSEDHKEKIKIACQNVTDEMRQKMSLAAKGRPSHRKGKRLTKEWRMKIRRGLLNMAPELKQKVIDGNKNRTPSEETRRKMRLARIHYIEKIKLLGAQMKPAFNLTACHYFNELNKQNGWNLQHAMNGGEYYLEDLGYWVDAYDKNKNIAIEYDEGYHNKRKDADTRRMNEIKRHLGCKFYRYDAVGEELKEY